MQLLFNAGVVKTAAKWSKLTMVSLLAGCMLLLCALAASPDLHELFHADAGNSDHQCAVALFAHGQVESSVVSVEAAVPAAPVELCLLFFVSVFDSVTATLPPGRAPPISSVNS